jgi:hypothetical protein
VILVLVEVLDQVPAASGNRAYAFQETLLFYARICPRAMRRQLEARDLPSRLAAIPSHARSYLIREAMEAASVWTSSALAERDEEIAHCLKLAKLVRAGHTEETETLLQAAQDFFDKRGIGAPIIRALLDSGSPAAREWYLARLSNARRAQISPLSHEPFIGVDLTLLLHPLFPEHTAIYFEQVRALLSSSSLRERKAGVRSLEFTLKCDFGFDPEALEADRSRTLASLEPIFEQLLSKAELDARAILLGRLGFVLEGEPGDAWLTTLQQAAASNNECAAPNALRIIAMIFGDDRLRLPGNLTPRQRGRAVAAWLHDSGRISN